MLVLYFLVYLKKP